MPVKYGLFFKKHVFFCISVKKIPLKTPYHLKFVNGGLSLEDVHAAVSA